MMITNYLFKEKITHVFIICVIFFDFFYTYLKTWYNHIKRKETIWKKYAKKINEIIINELKEHINKFTNIVNLNEDIISLINHIVDELENAYDLCYGGNIVSSMILLRSTFENMLFSMNILYNPELLEEYKK